MKGSTRVVLVVMLLLLLAPLTVLAQDDSATVTAAFLENEPFTLDPQAAAQADEFSVLYNVCEGLVGYDPQTLEPMPLLAESWDVSDDGTVYTFRLRSGVQFHNGREMTADDVKASLERLGNPETGTSYTTLLLNNVVGFAEMRAEENAATELSGVEVVDPQTIQITLTAPTASFLQQMTLPGAMVVAAETEDFGQNPICTGPYQISEWTRQQQLVLSAFADYWGGAPEVQQGILRVMPEQSQQVIEYEAGNLDIAWVPEPDLQRIRDDANLSSQLQAVPLISTWHLRINLKDPDLSKRDVRQALCQAIDRETLVATVLQGQGSPAQTLTAPGVSAFEPDYQPCAYDPEGARQLLADAGYPNGITLTVRTGQVETENRILAAIAQQVADAGITLNVNSTEKGVYDEDRAACNMQLGSIAWGYDYPDPDNILPLASVASGGSRLNCGYTADVPAVQQVAELLAQASTMPIGPERDAVLRQAEHTVMDNVLVIPVYHGTRSALMNPRLGGTPIDANSIIRFGLIDLQS